jgi:predicted enzyme involved in methoxymalonyl-ACP biosynthesis
VEEFALSTIVDIAREKKHKTIEGHYIPTAKNEMVRDHYPKMGFARAEGENTWHLAVEGWEAAPSFIMMEQL